MSQLTPQVQDWIGEIVKAFAEQKRMFTAFDVSRAVQMKGADNDPIVRVPRHLMLKHCVHAAIAQFTSSGEYLRELQDVGAAEMAFVYYPAGGDPSTYVPMQRPTATADTVAVASAVAATMLQPADDPKPEAPVDAPPAVDTEKVAGRMNIPSHVVKAAGFHTGDAVFVLNQDPSGEVQQPCAVLVKEVPDGFQSVAEYKTADGRIRVTNAVLVQCGLNKPPHSYSLGGSDGKITITNG